jgi:hypothetical protein
METSSSFHGDHHLLPLYWIGIAIILLVADYFAGPFIQFPITYLIPVALASWYNGRSWGFAFGFVLPLIRFFFNISLWQIPWTATEAGINCFIRIVIFSSFVILIDRIAKQTRQLTKEVNLLNGLLPICSYCKKIRNEKEEWQQIEQYIAQRSEASFTHGICPECTEKYYGQYFKEKSK